MVMRMLGIVLVEEVHVLALDEVVMLKVVVEVVEL